jgi:hypothetical protein
MAVLIGTGDDVDDDFTISIDSEGLPVVGQLKPLELRKVWNKEDRVFTPWLARQESLNLLADELGLDPIEKHGTEVAVGRYSADLLCRISNTEDYVLIENQIEPSDHKHLGQILTYVVGLDADGTKVKHVVWVAADFREEHLRAINWLNEHLDGKISVFAATVKAWRIGSSEPAMRFEVVAQPSNFTRSIRNLVARLPAEGIDLNRESYWAAFSEVLRARNVPVKIRNEPPRQGFYTFTIDASKGAYIYVYRDVSSKVIGAYLSLQGVPGIVRAVFERLRTQKVDIERDFGAPLDWAEREYDRNYRAQVQWVDGNALDESDWPRQHAWLADQVERLNAVFKPRIDAMPDKATLAVEAASRS